MATLVAPAGRGLLGGNGPRYLEDLTLVAEIIDRDHPSLRSVSSLHDPNVRVIKSPDHGYLVSGVLPPPNLPLRKLRSSLLPLSHKTLPAITSSERVHHIPRSGRLNTLRFTVSPVPSNDKTTSVRVRESISGVSGGNSCGGAEPPPETLVPTSTLSTDIGSSVSSSTRARRSLIPPRRVLAKVGTRPGVSDPVMVAGRPDRRSSSSSESGTSTATVPSAKRATAKVF